PRARVLLPGRRGEALAARRAEDGAAEPGDSVGGSDGKVLDLAGEEPLVAAPHADDGVTAALPTEDDAAHGGVHAGRVAAGREDCDLHLGNGVSLRPGAARHRRTRARGPPRSPPASARRLIAPSD